MLHPPLCPAQLCAQNLLENSKSSKNCAKIFAGRRISCAQNGPRRTKNSAENMCGRETKCRKDVTNIIAEKCDIDISTRNGDISVRYGDISARNGLWWPENRPDSEAARRSAGRAPAAVWLWCVGVLLNVLSVTGEANKTLCFKTMY